MGSENQTGYKSFTADAALPRFRRVKLTGAGTIDLAGATDAAIGVTTQAIASGAEGTIRLFKAAGTFLVTMSEAVAVNLFISPAADGKFSASGSTGTLATKFKLNEASTADGDIVEAIPVELAGAGGVPADITSSNLVGVDGAGSNAAPLAGTETRLDALETKVNAILAVLRA